MNSAGYPLSRQQQTVWASQQLQPDGDSYNVPMAYRLSGHIAEKELAEAIRAVLDRHAVLRVAIQQLSSGELRQSVRPTPDDILGVHQVTPSELPERLAAAASKPFSGETACRLRADLFRLSPQEAVLLMVFDHITVDAPSVGLIMEELGRAYTDALDGHLPANAPITESPYFAYVRQQQEWTNLPEGQEHTDFWEKYLEGMDALTSAPRKHAHGNDSPIRHSSHPVSFPADFFELVERRRVTPFAVLLSAYSLTLQHFLRSDDVLVSYPAVDWRRTEFDAVVGLFTDMMLFRCLPQAETSLQEYVREVQESLFTCLEHQGESLEKLWARMRMIAGGGAALPPMLSVNDLGTGPRFPGLEVERVPLIPRDGKSELLLAVNISGAEITGRLDFDPDVYAPATAQRLARALETVLGQIVDGRDGAARGVELITEADRSLVLDTWNAPPGEVDAPHVPESFLRRAAAAPEKVALIDEGGEVTYGELERASRALAARIAALGLPSGSIVALCLPRSARFVEAALAVLRCGLAFLPVDMEQPPRRRAFVLSDAGAAAVIVPGHAELGGLPTGLRALGLEDAEASVAGDGFEDRPVDAEDPAYVITTSGSTGLPKAVVVPHRALTNNFRWKRDEFGFRPEDRFYFKTPPIFDASVWEYLAPLTVGATLVVAPPGAHRDPSSMLGEMRRHAVTVAQFVPTLLKALLAEDGWDGLPALRRLFAGGEALDSWVVESVRNSCHAQVINLYGPTEAGCDATSHLCSFGGEPEATVPIGRPIPGGQAYVLGSGGQLLPPTFVGELCLGGLPLALGYANRAELTAERFVPHRFGGDPGALLYRTGDLARFTEDGLLEYHGRDDGQAKLRGLRVELDGIRNLLLGHPGIQDVVVTVRPELPDALIAYVVSERDDDLADLRGYLTDRLPSEHVPTHFVRLTDLPLTATGKVDVRALPLPEAGAAPSSHSEPRTGLERRLAALWAEVLGTDPGRVPRDVSLFQLGGSSLTLIHLHRRLRAEVSPGLSVTDLFKYPTVAAVARSLSRSENDGGWA
ncbi:amino acid adenylation domain-containing protein [Streptomyces sp. ME19-01-6]|uniref:non-ribosomal peptide synthetase n=1 Tax=Streptomyces sp. ME19-01-6 TaxID=3028686 RepID=UPI0029B424C2|nr:amino acid adenylation domain-containing protein [Streptomyces sp. ME19-01-6]MDX3226205.1 amino acid adenylation domain-containing protein [Streptomyces sp. ME19-01-6]